VEVFVFRDNLIHNLREYQRQYPKLSFSPVLKSNAYGHGLALVAKILDKESIAFLAVDSLFEAMMLRSEGIKSEILVIGYTSAENIKNSKLSGVAFTITSLEHLRAVSQIIDKPKKLHLKIDTGMSRQGLLPNQAAEAMGIIKKNKFINLEGLLSHLSDADGSDGNFTKMQIKQWQECSDIFRKNLPEIKYYHLSASSGIGYSESFASNTVRLGLGLYGFNVSSLVKLNLKPALRMESIISCVKGIPAGAGVGYNATYKTLAPIKIATVPVGYFEGVDRRLSNKGFLKIGGKFCPIIGRVSMNITTIDVSSVSEIKLGDKVIVISEKSEDKNSVEQMALLTQTIPYDDLVHIPQHLRRIII